MDDVPPGVTRCKECNQKATLDTCHALMFAHVHEGDERTHYIIAWQNEPANIKPVEAGMRLRDLRPGDAAEVFGRRVVLVKVEFYR